MVSSIDNHFCMFTQFFEDEHLFAKLELNNRNECTPKRIKRQLRFNKILENRKTKRVEEHRRKKARDKLDGRKRLEPIIIKQLNICLDLEFCNLMSLKERRKLIRQIGRIWGLQKRYSGLNTTLFSPPDDFLDECRKILCGFDCYAWNVYGGKNVSNLFPLQKITYLSPDADLKPLTNLSSDRIYVIGGLVDESGIGSQTKDKADNDSFECYRLPIAEFMQKTNKGTFNVMLPVNQVFEILCKFSEKQDWKTALGEVVPLRTGYRVAN